MKAVVISEYGGTDVLKPTTLAKPVVQPGHLLIKIAATSVNPVDIKIRETGRDLPIAPQPPAVLGMDFAGTVEEVGDGVDGFTVGDEVFGCAGGLMDIPGAMAEYMVADARLVAPKPSNLSMREAAALPLVSITAYEGLSRAGVKAGQKVLVHGGTGGVGHVAVQLARHLGAEVFATGGNDAKLEIIEGFGARGINYKTESVSEYVARCTDGEGFDVVFDSVGGENLIHALEGARPNAQVATTVSMGEVDLSVAHFKGLSLHVVFMLIPMIYNRGREAHGNILREITTIVENGGLTPLLDGHRYTMDTAAEAHALLESGESIGKVVIEVQS